jgi:predicted PurR-regulated permease PerM
MSPKNALALLLVLAFAAAVWVAAPLYVGIVLGMVMAFSAHPLYERLARGLRGRCSLAAVLTTVLGGTFMLAGSTGVVFVVVRQLLTLFGVAQSKLAGATPESLVGERAVRLLDAMHVDHAQLLTRAREQLGDLSGEAAGAAGMLVSTTATVVMCAVIALFTMYYVLLEWPRLATRLERVMPLDPQHTRALVTEFREVARTAFVGTVATGVVQGFFAAAGFAVAGVPEPLVWGVLTIIASFVPVFGTAIIWSPVAVWLVMQGRPVAAIFVVAWGLGIVMALSDYVIRPTLAGAKNGGHPLLTLLGLLGGIRVFGLAGLVVGPVIMSLFVAILRIYERDRSSRDRPTPAPAEVPIVRESRASVPKVWRTK